MTRVLAVGIDSVEETDLAARIDQGELPNFRALRDRGTWCSLDSDDVCRGERPWATFSWGETPRPSSWWTPVTFDATTYTYGTRPAPDVRPFWTTDGDRGVAVFDVPAAGLTNSPGVQLFDWYVHELPPGGLCEPPGLLSDVESEFGRSPVRPLEFLGTWNDPWWIERYRAAVVDSIQTRVEITERLLQRAAGWRLGLVVFGEPHELGHQAWHGVSSTSTLAHAPSAAIARDAISSMYAALDKAIGRLSATLRPEDTLVVFSPKGMEARTDLMATVLAPELLHRLRFGEPLLRQPSADRWRRAGCPPVLVPGVKSYRLLHEALRRGAGPSRGRMRERLSVGAQSLAYRLAPRVADSVRAHLAVRRDVRTDHPLPAPQAGTLDYDDFFPATWYRPWWPRMRAFVVPSFSDLHVRVNLAGRERDGTVAFSDYARACDEVEATFRACRSARTGNPLVEAITRVRADDPFRSDGVPADVVISWSEDTDALEHPDVGLVGPYPASRTGSHTARGFAVVAGGDVGRGHVDGRSLVDLPATILALADLTPHTTIDGMPIPMPAAARATGSTAR